MKFGYQLEKFSAARSALMLPHPRGESESIASAFHACSLGLHGLELDSLDDNVRDWIRKVEAFMDTAGLSNPDGRGLWVIKADSLTEEQKFELSRVVDELAHYFDREFWSTTG
jgi:hypothetical protein